VSSLETTLRAYPCFAVATASSSAHSETTSRDAELVKRARDGDVAAFEAIYRLHVARVLGLCLRMVGDRDRAEELTQEIFVRAWQKLGTYGERAAFSSWLHRVAVNTVMSHFRKTKHDRSSVPLEELAHAPEPTRQDGPGAGVDLERAIAALPPRARLVFVLYDIQGHRHDEVASFMDISVGASKAHLHRARTILREILGT